jgi:hypothetical protein
MFSLTTGALLIRCVYKKIRLSRKRNISINSFDNMSGGEKDYDFRIIDFPLMDTRSPEKVTMFCELLKKS